MKALDVLWKAWVFSGIEKLDIFIEISSISDNQKVDIFH